MVPAVRRAGGNQSKIPLASTQGCENAGNVFMATNTFGRRGVVGPSPTGSFQPAPLQPVAAPIAPRPLLSEGTLLGENKLLVDIPFLGIGLIFCLLLIWALGGRGGGGGGGGGGGSGGWVVGQGASG